MFENKMSLAMLAKIVEAKRVLNDDGHVSSDDKPMSLAEKLSQVVHLRASSNNHELESEGSELEKMFAKQRSKRGQ